MFYFITSDIRSYNFLDIYTSKISENKDVIYAMHHTPVLYKDSWQNQHGINAVENNLFGMRFSGQNQV